MTLTANPADPAVQPAPRPTGRAFIEGGLFPVGKLSKESYNERKSKDSQTLPALGKWWGRKPLVLVRAIILGLLLPETDDPEGDLATFLALMTMDDQGLLLRHDRNIPTKQLLELLPPRDRVAFVSSGGKVRWAKDVEAEERRGFQRRAFLGLGYDARLKHCKRPEEIDGPSEAAWVSINAHLGTHAANLPELVKALGERRFGHLPRIGDAFCGGGSIPFEAARIGCDAYASDLNPAAGLLTWGALNIVGGGDNAVLRARAVEERVVEKVSRQVDDWGIERNERGWVADCFLYCNEIVDTGTGWRVPLPTSWVIARQGARVIAELIPDAASRSFRIAIHENVSIAELERASTEGVVAAGVRVPVDASGNWLPTNRQTIIGMDQLRGASGLRRWSPSDIVPIQSDVYQERLYCVRWINPSTGERHYCEVGLDDLQREAKVLSLLQDRFTTWQAAGILPSSAIVLGQKTAEPIRARGWTHWHQLFAPRQLLTLGAFAEELSKETEVFDQADLLLSLHRLLNNNSKLCGWNPSRDQPSRTFYNQAINPLVNYAVASWRRNTDTAIASLRSAQAEGPWSLSLGDARSPQVARDVWITDPGYGDVILYDELSEYFLAWHGKHLTRAFPHWYADSKRALNVKGEGETFRLALAECYANLARHMPDNGFQVVMFTHQDPEVWADVGLTLWAAGLQVSAAWTVVTETPTAGVKGGGNYVQGTVILVLRKRTGERRGDLSDLFPDIQLEVKNQIETMLRLDPKDDPNFGDADYQLAAYAAALRVLTAYSSIEEIDVERELRRPRKKGETTPLARLIGQAVKIASDYLVPNGLDSSIWRKLGPEERLYLKGIEVEASGEAREGVYQELARGYGSGPHKELYANRSANKVRFKTPIEFAGKDLGALGDAGFRGSTLRQLLFAAYQTAQHELRDPRDARLYLRRELPDYWQQRLTLVELLRFLANSAETLPHWRTDLDVLRLLHGSLENDTV